jgi:hypothetical protein
MKDDTHPKPARENGNDTGDKTGHERGTERIHRFRIIMSTLPTAVTDCR